MSTSGDEGSCILLLTGVAGSGKSSIAHTIAEQFEELRRLRSSFFFNRSIEGRNRADNVFSTIACDLAGLDPTFKQKLWNEVKDNPPLRKTSSPREQFDRFILKSTEGVQALGPVVIVIDALDECGDPRSRTDLLDLLAHNVLKLPVGLCFLLTSRPEKDVIDKLGSLEFVHHIRMEEIDKDSTKNDISKFIHKELSDMVWPVDVEQLKEKVLNDLVKRAGELFIWASTACRFIRAEGEGGVNQADRLELILSSTSNNSLQPIDNLYLTVLRNKFDENNPKVMHGLRSVMGGILAAKIPLSKMALDKLFWEGNRAVTGSVVLHLGSILSGVTEETRPLQTCTSRSTSSSLILGGATRSSSTSMATVMHSQYLPSTT
jgi:hypothetical protein